MMRLFLPLMKQLLLVPRSIEIPTIMHSWTRQSAVTIEKVC